MSTQPLSHLQWRAPEFLLAFHSLSTRQLALDYFALSPFFDKASNNNQLRMQMAFSRGGMDGVDEERELARFVGVEYVVAEADPPNWFVIHKRMRTSPTSTSVLSVYHILNANVYQAPSLYNVLNERIMTSLHALSSSFSDLVDLKPSWTPDKLYSWELKPVTDGDSTVRQAIELDKEGGRDIVDGEPRANGTSSEEPAVDQADGEGPEQAQAVAGPVDKKLKLEDGASQVRPGEAFNPLLFRALQGVSVQIERERLAGEEAEASEKDKQNGAGGRPGRVGR
ncbi:hypothetical protein JCM10212_006373 [Sporobolomyces blumeae]